MVRDETMSSPVAIGVGCRIGCPAETIESLVRLALERVPDAAPLGLFTIEDKGGEAGLAEAARDLGLDVVLLSRAALREQSPSVQTRSPSSESRFGVPSVAEAAALAGAGAGAVLLVPRIAQHGATCAIAASRGDAIADAWGGAITAAREDGIATSRQSVGTEDLRARPGRRTSDDGSRA
jgi:cobalt-precorrin 5A hydrolase